MSSTELRSFVRSPQRPQILKRAFRDFRAPGRLRSGGGGRGGRCACMHACMSESDFGVCRGRRRVSGERLSVWPRGDGRESNVGPVDFLVVFSSGGFARAARRPMRWSPRLMSCLNVSVGWDGMGSDWQDERAPPTTRPAGLPPSPSPSPDRTPAASPAVPQRMREQQQQQQPAINLAS